MGKIGDQFEELVEIVSKLRSPEGCPWDREQTNHSLLPYFIEEVYEVIESIDENNWDLLKEELGDVLLHLVFQAEHGIRDCLLSRGLGDVYKRQHQRAVHGTVNKQIIHSCRIL